MPGAISAQASATSATVLTYGMGEEWTKGLKSTTSHKPPACSFEVGTAFPLHLPQGVLLDPALCIQFGIVENPDPECLDVSPQNWVLHACCGCRTASQLLVDRWLPVCTESSVKQNLGIKQ